jgi:hypothetical protein
MYAVVKTTNHRLCLREIVIWGCGALRVLVASSPPPSGELDEGVKVA